MTLSFQLFHVCQWQVVQVKADACPWQVIQGKAACPGGPSHDLCLSVTSCPRQVCCLSSSSNLSKSRILVRLVQGKVLLIHGRATCPWHGCLLMKLFHDLVLQHQLVFHQQPQQQLQQQQQPYTALCSSSHSLC